MEKREFVQYYMIENYDGGNVYMMIDTAVKIFDAIEETFVKPVVSTDLWKNEQR